MYQHWLKMTILATLSFLLVLGFSNTQASAKRHYVATPTNLRGTWYQYDKQTKSFAVMKMTKYSWYVKRTDNIGIQVSGKRFLDAHQSSCMLISRKYNNHGYWMLAMNQAETEAALKRTTTTHNGHKYVALREYFNNPKPTFTTWTHHKFR